MFEARLEECSVFRMLTDSLKEVVKLVNIQINKDGLSIKAMDSCHVACVSFLLKEKTFSHYSCHKPLTLGLAIQNVCKIMRISEKDDSMTLQCHQDSNSLKFIFQSKNGKKITQFNLFLMNLQTDTFPIQQEIEFSSICVMPSDQFNRICRQYGNLSDSINIQTNKECIKFSINGEIGVGSTTFNHRQYNNQNAVLIQVDQPVSLCFASRYLNLFSKAGIISPQVTINMESQRPLMIEYKFSDGSGLLKYYIAPKIPDQQ